MQIGNVFGNRIKELMLEKDMTIYRLSKLTCLHHKTIQNLIKGKSQDITMTTIYLISNAFQMQVTEFINPSQFRNTNIFP